MSDVGPASAEPSPRIHVPDAAAASADNGSKQVMISAPTLARLDSLRRHIEVEKMDVSSWLSQDLLPSLVDTVVLARSTERGVNQFQRHRTLNAAFRQHLSDVLQELMPADVLKRILLAHLLVACKVAAESVSFASNGHTEVYKRKQHALRVVQRILEHPTTIALFQTDHLAQLVLRRHVCISVLESCVTIVPSMFQLVLRVFSVLWTHYRNLLKSQLGIILDAVLLSMLESKHCWPEQKSDLIGAVSRLFQTPQSLVQRPQSPPPPITDVMAQVELFYNFDNELNSSRNLYTRLLRSLCQLAERRRVHSSVRTNDAMVSMTTPTLTRDRCRFRRRRSRRRRRCGVPRVWTRRRRRRALRRRRSSRRRRSPATLSCRVWRWRRWLTSSSYSPTSSPSRCTAPTAAAPANAECRRGVRCRSWHTTRCRFCRRIRRRRPSDVRSSSSRATSKTTAVAADAAGTNAATRSTA